MKIDQIAFYCTDDAAVAAVKEHFGLEKAKWHFDTVTAISAVRGHDAAKKNVALLQFNYDLGIELEILRYIDGPNWHITNRARNPEKPYISHVGIHLEDNEPFPDEAGRLDTSFFELVQETRTQSHTAPYLTDPESKGFGRLYHYKIYEMAPGHYVKYIRRIHPEAN